MPNFEISLPEGKRFQVEAPDFETAVSRLTGRMKPAGPSFDSPEFDKALAEKYGASPEHVRGLKESASAAAALEGVPIAGAGVNKLGGYLSALSGGGATGENFSERAKRNSELDAEIQAAYREAHPIESTVAPIFGGGVALGGLGATAAGARALGIVGGGIGRQVGAGALSGGAIGGADAAARGGDIGTGAALGALLGGVAPGAIRAGAAVASPIVNRISAGLNPERYAQGQVARALTESGQTPQQIADAVAQAAREGQPMFTPADAMGISGQKLLGSAFRGPGQAGQTIEQFLESRQAGQGRRVASQLAEGFNSPLPAEQVSAARTAARDAAANVEYEAARQNAGPVDLSRAIANIDATLMPGATQVARPQSGLAHDSIEAALESVRRRLTDDRSVLTDFTAVQRVRGDLADQVQQAVNRGQGNRARLLGGVLREMDQAMESASPGFLQANRNFAGASRDIEAIAQGRTAANRGRSENTIPAYQQLGPGGQSTFRAGYVDPLIERAQGSAVGRNKAQEFTSDAFQAEARAMSPNPDLLARQLGRENTMFETRGQATKGSATAQRLADDQAMATDSAMAGHVLSGNYMGALRSAIGNLASGNAGGNTAAVREAVANILLARNLPPATFQRMLDETTRRIMQIQRAATTVGRTAAGLGSVAANRANAR
jgi:hypothetical protein